MNRMQQIHVGLLTSMMVAACLATENKPFYEVLHEQEFFFDVEDYHADIVLGMLPHIKTSIKDFRKRNFTNNDIENMYQTLTIFWPVVRKYLHLKEEFIDDNSSEDKEMYKQISSPPSSSSSSSSSENNTIKIKDNVEFDNAQAKSKIDQSQISQSAPLVYKRDQPISSKIEINRNGNQGAILNPKTSVSTPSRNKQNINRRKYVARFKSIRDSLPLSDNYQTEMTNPETSALTPSKDKQNTNRRNLVKFKGIRQSSPISNDNIRIQSNFQSARTTSTKNNSVNSRPFKSINNKHFSTTATTTISPSRRPFRTIGLDSVSVTDETTHKTTSTTPFSYTTRRPYKRTFTPISPDSISPAIERLIQKTGTTAIKNNSANVRSYKSTSNESFSNSTRKSSKNPYKLANQDTISTTEELVKSIAISTPVPYLSTSRRTSKIPSKPVRVSSTSTQEERPFTSFYHNLLRNSALRLLQTATNTPTTDNISKYTRTPDRPKSTNSTGRSIPTTKFTPVNKSTSSAIRSKHTIAADRSISTTSTPILASTISHTASNIITSSSPQATVNVNSRNSATDGNGVTNTSPVVTLKHPINENRFFYTDLSSIMRALGNPIDLTNLTG